MGSFLRKARGRTTAIRLPRSFAGISLEGATLAPDPDTNRDLYGHDATNREILTGDFKTPAAAAKFERALHRDSAHRK